MIPTSSAEQVLQTLAGFKAYAAGTLLVLELAGTFVFALSGAAAGVKHRLDLFGVLVVSCATATAGGITRDVLIGAVPSGGTQGLALPRNLGRRRVDGISSRAPSGAQPEAA